MPLNDRVVMSREGEQFFNDMQTARKRHELKNKRITTCFQKFLINVNINASQ